MSFDAEYARIRANNRQGVKRVMAAIRAGSVEEIDLDKLENFCMSSLMLMTKVNRATWRAAERAAEVAGLLHELGQEEDDQTGEYSVVLANNEAMESPEGKEAT